MKRSEAKKLGQENNCFTNDSRIDYFLDILVECGLEFEPEEFSAVEKWNEADNRYIDKKPYVESPELKEAREFYFKQRNLSYEMDAHLYILELEHALKELTA